jgi:hypothetical protein
LKKLRHPTRLRKLQMYKDLIDWTQILHIECISLMRR